MKTKHHKKPIKNIYLDYAGATPVYDKALKSMIATDFLFANASSIHKGGVEVRRLIEEARSKVAKLISAHNDEIIFTSSGTESVAMAIIGIVHNYKNISDKKKLPHIVTSTIEHPAVLENCRMLEKNNEAEVTYISPDSHGLIDNKKISEVIKDNTILVSIMYANNEIGTIEPIEEIAKAVRFFRKKNNSMFPFFHTDACQAMNYLPTSNIEKLGVDMMTFNSSKIYGPKGIGVLYKKRKVEIEPLYLGGGQEFGLRPGTENLSLISGLATAFEHTCKIKEKESKRLITIRDEAIKKLLSLSKITGYNIILNGDPLRRLPNNINISISGISSELLVIELDAKGIAISAKSACKSDDPDESYVIGELHKAQNIKSNSTDGSIRISLGRSTTKQDLDKLVTKISSILDKYRKWQ